MSNKGSPRASADKNGDVDDKRVSSGLPEGAEPEEKFVDYDNVEGEPMSEKALTEIEDSTSACALIGTLTEDYELPIRKKKGSDVQSDSGFKLVQEILSQIFKKATKPKPIKHKKKPVMKSGWIHLEKIIPAFDVDDEIFKKMIFPESLLVSTFETNSAAPTPVGGLSLDIQAARGGPLRYQKKKTKGDFLYPKFLVHLSSQFDYMGLNGGSRITSWVDRDLQTLEEKRREYLKREEGLDQQALYVSSQENFYYLRHNKNKDIFYSPQKAKNLICEGSSFILMRYLALTKFVGTFELSTLYIDGSLCRNIYECWGPSSGIVNGSKLDVCKIYRTIIEECGIEHKAITLMTLNGQILKQEWIFCNYILQLNPLVKIKDGKPSGLPRIPLEKQIDDDQSKVALEKKIDDIQLLSLYLDAKTINQKLIENYMEDHPEIKDMLADYVQILLQLKPEDVFDFTAKYFLAFTPHLLPQSEYFEKPYSEYDDEDYEFWKYI